MCSFRVKSDSETALWISEASLFKKNTHIGQWAGWRSRYSDWLRAGRSGDRIPVGARFSAPVQTGPEAHPASCTMGTGSFPGARCGRGVTVTPHPLIVPRSKIEQYYTSNLPKGLRGLWKGETYPTHVGHLYIMKFEHNQSKKSPLCFKECYFYKLQWGDELDTLSFLFYGFLTS
jgi:hypothetical protein